MIRANAQANRRGGPARVLPTPGPRRGRPAGSAGRETARSRRTPWHADLIVSRSFVEPPEEDACRGRDHGHLVVRSRECLHRLQRVEPHNGDELDLWADRASEQFDPPVAGDPPLLDPREDLRTQKPLVVIRDLRVGPAPPELGDHHLSFEPAQQPATEGPAATWRPRKLSTHTSPQVPSRPRRQPRAYGSSMAKRHVPSAWRRTTSMASPVLSIGFPSRPFADMCQSLYPKPRSSPAPTGRTRR